VDYLVLFVKTNAARSGTSVTANVSPGLQIARDRPIRSRVVLFRPAAAAAPREPTPIVVQRQEFW